MPHPRNGIDDLRHARLEADVVEARAVVVPVQHVEVVGEVGDVDVVAAVVVVVGNGDAHVRLARARCHRGPRPRGSSRPRIAAAPDSGRRSSARSRWRRADRDGRRHPCRTRPRQSRTARFVSVDARLSGHVGERAIAVVAEQVIRRALAARVARTSPAGRDRCTPSRPPYTTRPCPCRPRDGAAAVRGVALASPESVAANRGAWSGRRIFTSKST